MFVETIEPGLLILRSFLNDEQTEHLAKTTMASNHQFFVKSKDTGQLVLNTGEKRGRIYDHISQFPGEFLAHSDKAVALAREHDKEMPEMNCTHLLLNMYTSSEGLTWHRDIYENDGKSDHPVVNLCVGASCRFGFKHEETDKEREVTLRSGDCLLFGGPCRWIKHAVLEILLEECPDWMKDDPKRFSFTFRDVPEVVGREDEFKFFKIKEHLVGQDSFEKPADIKSFRGLPSLKTQSSMVRTRIFATTTI
jgi:alkylated DNA repair dioxygenase AlkB